MTTAADLGPPPNPALEPWRRYLMRLAANGGPEDKDTAALDGWFDTLADARREGRLTDLDLQFLLAEGGDAISSLLTLQGFARLKPHGYAGDFELIDRILAGWRSPAPELRAWDRYFLSRPAMRALCHSRDMFIEWVRRAEARPGRVHLLHLGGGPARELEDIFRGPGGKIAATYLDPDPKALAYAGRVCASAQGRITFVRANPLRLEALPVARNLIWAGSLLDSLDDANATDLLRRLWRVTRPGGEILGANFSLACPTLSYMEILGWPVMARSPGRVADLARQAGIAQTCLRLSADPTGSLTFLHLSHP